MEERHNGGSDTHTHTPAHPAHILESHIKHGSGDLRLADCSHARRPLDDEWQGASPSSSSSSSSRSFRLQSVRSFRTIPAGRFQPPSFLLKILLLYCETAKTPFCVKTTNFSAISLVFNGITLQSGAGKNKITIEAFLIS